MLIEIVLTLFYTSIFIWLIFKWKFFHFEGIRKIELTLILIIKILAGIVLTLIYTYYYVEREEADIFKFFDDSQYLFNAIYVNPIHYLQLVFGINADADYLKDYVKDTKFWALQTDEYWKFTATENHNYFNSHRLVTQFNAFVRLFSFGHYTVHTVFMCFISLIGLTGIYKTFICFLREKKKLLIFSIYFMPSVLLWSSGVLKEGFIFLGTGLFVYGFFKFIDKKSIKGFILIFLSILLIVFVKYYLLASLIPAILAYWIAEKTRIKQKISIYLGIYISVFLLVFLLSFLSDKLPNPLQVLSDKQSELIRESIGGTYCIRNNSIVEEIVYFAPDTKIEKTITDSARNIFQVQQGIIAYKYKDGKVTGEKELIDKENSLNTYYWEIFGKPTSGSHIELKKLEPNIISFLKASPFGIVNVLFRPHLFEMSSLIMLPAALENLLILIIFILCIFFHKLKKKDVNLALFLIFSVFSLYLIIGITTPVLGTVVRYKSPLLPFLTVFLLMIIDLDKFKSFIKKKMKY